MREKSNYFLSFLSFRNRTSKWANRKLCIGICISRSGVRWIISKRNQSKTFIERNMCGNSDDEKVVSKWWTDDWCGRSSMENWPVSNDFLELFLRVREALESLRLCQLAVSIYWNPNQPTKYRRAICNTVFLISCSHIGINLHPENYPKFFLYMRNDAGMPITNGVGASKSCSAQLMHVGNNGITGNIYSSG